MGILLLAVIYIAFIGLGVPDSLFGAAWPAIYGEFHIPFSYGSFISAIVYLGTTVSSILSARLIKKFGTYKITVFSTALTAAALLAFSYSGNYASFCLYAIPLGLGAGCIDTALNNYVAMHYSSKHMNFLHCFYGIGITLSPYILSMVITGEQGWRGGYRITFLIQAALTCIILFSFPLWKKASNTGEVHKEEQIRIMTLKEIIKTLGVKPIWIMLIGISAVESICNVWGSTYLVEYKSLAPEIAAGIVLFYFIGMACGRFGAGLIASKLNSWQIIFIGQVILGIALVVLLFPGNKYVSAVGLFLIGLGNGPLFPNVNYLTPENFGAESSPSIMGTQMSVGSIALMCSPILCGFLGQLLGMWVFTVILLLFYIIMVMSTVYAKKVLAWHS